MKYEVYPTKDNLLLENVVLETNDDSKPKFFLEEEADKPEFFRIIGCGPEVKNEFDIDEIIIVENYTPIGSFEGKDLFLTNKKFVTAIVIKKD